jgi:hypothetical protein
MICARITSRYVAGAFDSEAGAASEGMDASLIRFVIPRQTRVLPQRICDRGDR